MPFETIANDVDLSHLAHIEWSGYDFVSRIASFEIELVHLATKPIPSMKSWPSGAQRGRIEVRYLLN